MQTFTRNGSSNGAPAPTDRFMDAMIAAGIDTAKARQAAQTMQGANAAMSATANRTVADTGSVTGASWDDLNRAAPFVCAMEGPTGQARFVLDFPAGHRVLGISDDGMRLATHLIDDTNALIERGAYAVDRFGKLSFTEHGFRIFDAYYLGERTATKLYAHDGAQEIGDFQLTDGITVDPGFFYTKITIDRATAQGLIDALAMGALDVASLNLPFAIGLGAAALVTLIANNLGRGGVCIYFLTFNPLFPPQILPRF